MTPTTLFFLASDAPLSKSFWLDQGELQKSSYPNVKNFTSWKESVTSVRDMYAAISKHAALGNCLVKGTLHKTLHNESRAGSTHSDDATRWICLDLDGSPYPSAEAFINANVVFKDVAYVVQHSASYGIADNKKLSCHIFMLLDAALPAATVKTWLMELNLTNATLREALTLSRTGAALHWSVDVSACQNDKLLYICPPTIGKGVVCTLKASERIQLIAGKQQFLSAKSIMPKKSLEQLKKESNDLKNMLRRDSGLAPLRAQTKFVGEHEIQPKPGEAAITGSRIERGFVYLNLNGGDSWGYYHPVSDYELIFNFKGEPVYYTKELLPDYYKDKVATQRARQSQPTEAGEVVLAFRDKRTARYFNGTWHPDTFELDLHPAKSELQLAHWMLNHNKPAYDVIPVWDICFDPQSEVIVDEKNKRLNTYAPTPWFRQTFASHASLNKCPLIKRIIMHAVSGGKEDETFECFLNWLAVIFQHRAKPKTAWILHGTEGTGKGLLINSILAPLLGRNYVQTKRATELEEKYTGWLEQALIAFIDEIEVGTSARKDAISGDLRNFITEDVVTIRNMHTGAIQIKNYTGFIFSSNKSAPVEITAGDRRYNIGCFQLVKLLISQREIDTQIPAELAAFMSYIMTREACIEKAAQPLKNEAHMILVQASRTSSDEVAHQLNNGDIMSLWDSVSDPNIAAQLGSGSAFATMYRDILKREITSINESITHKDRVAMSNSAQAVVITTESRLKRDELLVIFEHCVGNMPKTPNKFTSLLRHRNMVTERMRFGDSVSYGIKIVWRAASDWLEERMQEFAIPERKNQVGQRPQLARVK